MERLGKEWEPVYPRYYSVNPIVESVHLRVWTGRTAHLKGRPRRTGILASVRETYRGGPAGTVGVSGCGICCVPPLGGWALKVTGGTSREFAETIGNG